MQAYETEQENKRKLGTLEPLTADDFVIDENAPYAFTVLKDFFTNKKIAVEDESEVLSTEILALRPVEVKDNEDGLTGKYELKYDVEGTSFTENVEVKVTFGTTKSEKLAVILTQVSGNRLYFKKIAKEIKNLYTYCLA